MVPKGSLTHDKYQMWTNSKSNEAPVFKACTHQATPLRTPLNVYVTSSAYPITCLKYQRCRQSTLDESLGVNRPLEIQIGLCALPIKNDKFQYLCMSNLIAVFSKFRKKCHLKYNLGIGLVMEEVRWLGGISNGWNPKVPFFAGGWEERRAECETIRNTS